MKYPQLVSMPEALRCWLEEQLEARGIDAAIYSRYIFSLLQQKSLDDIPTQKSGIEALVDELCAKLKVIQSEASTPQVSSAPTEATVPLYNLLSSHELEQKYYSAFPPLIKKANSEIFALQTTNSSVWNGRKVLGCSFGKNQSVSNIGLKEIFITQNNKWAEENKENQEGFKERAGNNEKMRSRSMMKQHVTQKVRKNMAKSLDRKDDLLKLKVAMDGGKTRRLDDPNLAWMLSKFDYGVKSLWSNEKSIDDLSGCDEELPMDFQQLLDSPDTTDSSDSIPFELYKNINNKQNIITSYTGSFIQCGTNITSSIWSEKSDGIKICLEGCDGSDNIDSVNNNSILPSLSGSSVWSNNNNVDENNKSMFGSNDLSEAWGFGESVYLEMPIKKTAESDEMDVSFFKERKWSSDTDGLNFKMLEEETVYSSKMCIDSSLSTLNHNKDGSSFIEVVPTKPVEKLVEKYDQRKPKFMNCLKSPEKICSTGGDDDEDLLTSMRTHFRPIGTKEPVAKKNDRVVPSALKFADGTTFQVSNSLDKPSFLRSESGAFYLDSDHDQKYREFIDDSSETSDNFVPKFKVCQNEKFCQTVEPPVSSCSSNGFYFPGDEKHAEDCLEKDSTTACITGWVAAWPAGIWSNTPQPWCKVWNAGGSEAQEDADHYLQLRDEILEEGEELLSDLSSMQNLMSNNVDETPLPGAATSQVESDLIFKTNSIPLSSEVGRKANERHFTLKVPQKEYIRQPLAPISTWAGPVVM